jgi:hypothetical protein
VPQGSLLAANIFHRKFERMADDKLRQFESVLGAISKITSDEKDIALEDAKCPQCGATDFAAASDLYSELSLRIEEAGPSSRSLPDTGLTDEQILRKIKPPVRKSAIWIALLVGVPLATATFLAYRRLGDTVGQVGIMVSVVLTVVAFVTRVRRNSDDYYAGRRQWRRLHICRRCGQLVA